MLKSRKVLIAVTASIAAYKTAELVRLFKKAGASVKVIQTEASLHFVTPLTLATLSENPILSKMVDAENEEWNSHVDLGIWADFMIIASGTSSRHIQSLSEQVLEKLKDSGIKNSKIEGKESSEWKLVDGIDVIVHIFHPEKRKFYELEKIWSELIPKEKVII